MRKCAVGEVWGSLNTRGRVFPTESETAIKDPARMWSHGETSNYGLDTRVGREHPVLILPTRDGWGMPLNGRPCRLHNDFRWNRWSPGGVNEAISIMFSDRYQSVRGTDQTGADARAGCPHGEY
jgi:hypothetical protein